MKILYHHRIASKDGQYVHVDELTRALKALGHELVMIGPAVVDEKEFGSEGGRVASLKKHLPGFLYEVMEFCYAFLALAKLLRAVWQHKPDVIYERYNLYMPAGIWLKKITGLPLLLEVNAPLFEERKKYNGIAIPWLAKWTERYAWRNADKVLPVTQVLAEIVGKEGVPQEKIQVIHNGIDPARFNESQSTEEAKKALGLDGKLVLGFTGFIREWHGLEQIVDLLVAGSEERFFLIVGDGPARESILSRAKALGVEDKIRITGVVQRNDVANYVSAFDIALQPDVVDYASPLKMFEYLALGRAIVAPRKLNILEILEHQDNALLFDIDDSGAFSAAIERLCEDHQLRKHISERAKKTIDERGFTWASNATLVMSLLDSLSKDA